MGFHPFEVNAPHLVYTILGGFTVIFGMLSLIIKEKLYIGEAPIATILGIIIGPYALNFFDPYAWGGGRQSVTDEITLEVTRVVIAIGVFAVGVELPKVSAARRALGHGVKADACAVARPWLRELRRAKRNVNS